MDWNAAIEKNREALKRVLAMLVAMAGIAGGAAFTSPLWGGRRSSDRRVGVIAAPQPPPDASRRPPYKGEVEPALTLPRHLHRAILRLLRPAESAARRLIIVAARGIVIALPPARPREPLPTSIFLGKHGGTGIYLPPGAGVSSLRGGVRGGGPTAGTPCLPLFDPLRPFRPRPKRLVANGTPRISIPGLTRPVPVPRAPAPDDPIDATRLAFRLGALARALDDLPREARRFARWRAARHAARTPAVAGAQKGNRDAAGAQNRKPAAAGRFRRVWPLRPGRPPGGRLARYDPDARRGKNIRDVDEILAHAHALACYALGPDTS